MMLSKRDEEKREEGRVETLEKITKISEYLQDNPSASAETVAEQSMCTLEEVLRIMQILNIKE